jgi:hypothetical protein
MDCVGFEALPRPCGRSFSEKPVKRGILAKDERATTSTARLFYRYCSGFKM